MCFRFHPKELEFSQTSIRGRPERVLDNADIPGPEVPGVPNFWSEQLTLFQPGKGTLCPPITTDTQIFFDLDISGAPLAFKTWYRHATRVKNPGGHIVLGGDNVPPWLR